MLIPIIKSDNEGITIKQLETPNIINDIIEMRVLSK
jgi:hypothetical protein